MEVRIYNGRHKTWTYRKQLKRMGFVFESNYYTKDCTSSESTKIKRFCAHHKLEYVPINKNYSRSTTYRQEFFRKKRGLMDGKYYWCAYCGRIKKRANITVDHLIPVNKVLRGKHRSIWRTYLSLHGIKNVNQVENLVPACKRCNSKKGTKTGIWVVRGRVGNHFFFWLIYKPIRLGVIIFFLYFIQKYLFQYSFAI